MTDDKQKMWVCDIPYCDHIYNPALGDPIQGIPKGTLFENLPASWKCPKCGVDSSCFHPYEQ